MKKESEFQRSVIAELEKRLPGCLVTKQDPSYIQGIPDLAIFYEDKWAMLECKKSKKESHQPNQDYYIEQMNNKSFAAFIYPENRKEILDAMEQTLRFGR